MDNMTYFVVLYAVSITGSEELIGRVKKFVADYGLQERLLLTGARLVTTRSTDVSRGYTHIDFIQASSSKWSGRTSPQCSDSYPNVPRVINNSESKVTTKTP